MDPWWRNADTGVLGALVTLAGFLFFVILYAVAVVAREGRELTRRRVLAQLALAAERALPLSEALKALANDLERPFGPRLALIAWLVRRERAKDREAIDDVAALLQEGDLRRALESAPGVFPAPLPEVLGTAEREGTLVAALDAVRALDGEADRFRSTVRGRLLYPLAVLFSVSQTGAFLLVVLLPKIRDIYEGTNLVPSLQIELAAIAQEALSLGVPLLILGLWVGAAALVPGSLASRVLRGWPLRQVRESARVALLARMLAAFLRAGATVPDALRMAGQADAARRASEGGSLADALAASGALPARTAAELTTATRGEAPLAQALELVAAKAAYEHSAQVDRLSRAVLPIALAALGALVASYYWPTFLELQDIRSKVLW